MLYIRTDGNGEIGTGHVMRCLSVAEEYRRQGGETIFLMADNRAGELIEKNGFSYMCLDSVWNDLEQELDTMVGIIEEKRIPLLLVDSYFVTEKYLSTVRKHTKVAYIDDLNQFVYPVDLLINYNIYAEKMDYKSRYRNTGLIIKFALGCGYAPLRREFRQRVHFISEHARKVLITTGGTDAYDVTGHLLRQLHGQSWFSKIEFEVIIGRFNSHNDELVSKWGTYGNIHFHCDVTNMAEYMTMCDIAVTAGGSTVYELMACGTPAIVYTLADNQREIAQTVSEMDLMSWAGDVRENIEACCRTIICMMKDYIEDYERRKQISRWMREMVDGNGSKRLVSVLNGLDADMDV